MSSEASLDDKLAINRALDLPDPASIPTPPKGYQPTDPILRSARLKKVAKNLEAELHDALLECAKLGGKVTELLGEYAPSGDKAAPLAAGLEQVQDALSNAYELVRYLEEKKAILLSDGRAYVELVMREYEHHADRKPGLTTKFKETAQFSRAIGEAIREGRTEAKKRREAGSRSSSDSSESPQDS